MTWCAALRGIVGASSTLSVTLLLRAMLPTNIQWVLGCCLCCLIWVYLCACVSAVHCHLFQVKQLEHWYSVGSK